MTYSVPDWDDTSNALTAFDHTFPPCQLKKGATLLHQHPSQLAQLQRHHHSALQTNLASALVPIASDDMMDSVTLALPGMQRYDCTKSSDRLGSSAIPAPNSPLPLSNACVHEDEMLNWLRYPLEDSFDRNYCSDMFGDLINPHVQLVKDVFLHQSMKDSSEISHVPISEDNVGSDVVSQETKYAAVAAGSPRKGIKTDAAMALGAGRAAGVLSQAGSEAFRGVRTHLAPCGILKPSSSPLMKPSSDDNTTDQISNTLPTVLPTYSAYNFSLFSRPLATTMDNLHFVGVASGPTNSERARHPLSKESPPPCDPCAVDSNGRIAVNMSAFQQLGDYNSQRRVESAGKACRDWCSSPSVPHEPFSLSHTETMELNSRVSCVSFSGTALEASEAVEAAASPTCLSGSSVEKVTEEVVTFSKKSTSTALLSEQDVEDSPANARKPPLGPRAGKRSRAAEVHNESEKKRRNKINVRLKLLQSLIPNSNKTDKASVLDEAIEYTKMLQAQVQFMSMKAGMFLPTMVHSGMQYVVPMEQLPTVSHVGMGAGMPIGMSVDLGFGLPVSGANAANMNGSGGGIVGATCAGAGDGISVLPTVPQPFSHPCAGSQLVQKRSCSPIYDVSSSMPVASAPLRFAMTQQLPQGLMNVHMNANVYSASQQ